MSTRSNKLLNRLTINPDEAAPAPARVALRPEPSPAPAPRVEPEQIADVRSEPVAKPVETNAPRPVRRRPQPVPEPQTPVEGSAYFRSFYVSNEVYSRFRASVFWSSRNPKAVGNAPENMSSAIESAMLAIAEELENHYNNGEAFPEPPATRKRRRKTDDS